MSARGRGTRRHNPGLLGANPRSVEKSRPNQNFQEDNVEWRNFPPAIPDCSQTQAAGSAKCSVSATGEGPRTALLQGGKLA